MKEKEFSRRQFIKYSTGGMAGLVVASRIPSWLMGSGKAYAAVQSLNFTISDTIKEMVTHNAINTAECYFWVFKEANLPADSPGPTIYVNAGDTVNITITNELDEPHSMVVPELGFDTGPIAPVQDAPNNVFTGAITVGVAGTFLYYDNLNAPVNRVMGLHGIFLAMPPAPATGHKWTPYDNPTPQVQLLFDELGSAGHWPGLAWEEGNPATLTPSFRQYCWVLSQASPILFRDVGSLPAGVIFPAADFVQRFRHDAFSHNSHDLNVASDIPQYFLASGQSGHFAHNNPVFVPMARVGEPVVIRVINAGLMTHSMHIHCNHFYIINVDGVVQGTPVGSVADNATLLNPGPIWVDTFTANPMGFPSHKYDLVLPFMRPPDVPNARGIGRGGCPDQALTTVNGGPAWPPYEEFDRAYGKTIPVRQSPLCYPAHDHSEPSQTAQGGNYNCGVIGGQYIIGDLNVELPRYNVNDDPAMPILPPQTFPMDEDFHMMMFREDGTIAYGMDEAATRGIQEASRDSGVRSQDDRPPFPHLP